MPALAEQDAWDAYVDEYYGEAHKFGSPADRTALVAGFEQQWGDQVLAGLRQAAPVTPTIDDEGRAVFSVDGQPVFVLYKSDTGRWTFHLQVGIDEPTERPSQDGHGPSHGHGPKARPLDAPAEPIGTKSKHRAAVGKWRECDRPLLGGGAPPDECYQAALTLRTSPHRTDHGVPLKV